MTFPIGALVIKTQKQVHDDILRVVRNGMIARGVPNPQLGPGSTDDIWATAIANETQPLYVNTVIKADAQMPDTASIADPPTPVGSDLTRLMAIKGLTPRPAVPAAGFIVLACSAPTIIADGTQLTDAGGLRFQVQTPGSYSNGALVPVIGVDTGLATDHAAGDTLVWATPPPFCNPKQLVATGGLTGGYNAEDSGTARGRLLDREQNPPGSGNWAQQCGYAEQSTAIVQKAFCYPAVNGPSTVHLAVVGYTGPTSVSRVIASTVMLGTVQPYVLGQDFEGAECIITGTTDQPTDISMGLSLPAAPTASPSGPGGGWIDGTPWPAISGTGQTYANVTAVTSSTQFTVNAPTAPTAGVTHICMVDMVMTPPVGQVSLGTLLRAKVLAVSGSAGAYVVTVDTPFPNVTASGGGTFIFPDATNMTIYVATLLASMALMGPGEKTSNTSVLSRGYRHPTPQASWPYAMGGQQLKAVENAGAEVLQTLYYLGNGVTPAVPGSVTSPPAVLVPARLGFYPI